MSRIIVKNLPKKITADKLSEIFSSKGHITDLQLKYTKEGAFRQFAFIGFKEENEAQLTKEYFHNTYIGASKIKVEICINLGEPTKCKTWSKILKDETVHNRKCAAVEEQYNSQQIKKLKGDSQFSEFMELSKSRKSKPIWSDGTDDFQDLHNRIELNSKVEFNKTLSSQRTQNSRADDEDQKGDNIDKEDTEFMNNEQKCYDEEKTFDDEFTLKLRNLPYQCKKKHIREFFHPLKPASLRCPPKCKGFAYIKFKTEKEMKQAVTKHRGFLGGHRIDVIKYKKSSKSVTSEGRRAKVLPVVEDEESITESGRIYVRNLCYTATEEEVGDLFSKYGPLAEVHLPIDSFTKKGVGFAFISYMFPEHAIKAFTDLDGTVFQGRLLHLIPSKSKKKIQVDPNAELSYKEKKEAKLKALSVSSHNWNTLFLGANAVADAMTEKYNTSKSQLLSNESKDSVAVRMALGETQLVMETRDFLLKHGVQLDAFNKPATKRSNTVIIAKNLPAKSTSEEIYRVFSKFGDISQVILPPSGITAIIVFQQAEEARNAFKNLAYSKFQHVPLYLEWAPVNLLTTKPYVKTDIHKVEINMQQEETDSTRSFSQIKHLEQETTLFVKNLNFETNEESLKKHFEECGDLQSVSVSKKKDFKTGKFLSMGFGFVQYKQKNHALRALQELQHKELDGHFLQLKISDRAVISASRATRKQVEAQGQESTKILIRNIPFEATVKEIRDLFSVFGELKSVRLPKKLIGTGTHRGFGFVDFLTRNDAKRAFTALCHSTHLLGRRLVLEWANMDSEDVIQLRKKTADHFYRGSKRTAKKAKLLEDAASVVVDE